MSNLTVVYGGTFNPPHNGHLACVGRIKLLGHQILVVPSAGHEFKPETRSSYEFRKRMCFLAFGEDMAPIEDHIDLEDPRRALLVMRKVRSQRGGKVTFGIGPDINPTIWTGYQECLDEGFSFLRLEENGDGFVRSSVIRERLEKGLPIDHLVPPSIVKEMSFSTKGTPKL